MNLFTMEVVLLCYAIIVAWTLCGLFCGVAFLLRAPLRRQQAELYGETVQLHSRFVRRRKRRDGWTKDKERAAKKTHADLVRRRQVYGLLALPQGEMIAMTLIRAQECTEHENATTSDRRALSRAFGIWVSRAFEGLESTKERKRFLDKLGQFLEGWSGE